ncbi:bifunctional ADP-dependent NAD(P)H-hydrate dehydratase/NAD(P)H-hydrate epimerase [Ornithinimicrobium cerasi]|uniref:ADP-dependent (S)-NAD(P)H-hydrate dehydratase n=1 Tax=Ornithinimicrobium cerasi TaxID=2248773 RepID=A0A285VII3_9MICO|nr:bifunctional ADP-dependent NAD(P)H-hydrate dehydratase/NAD(P)H-hydrate epimerase [Ornithinimicrobium cerasi]SOC53860.1 yjeF C-terminal region, hydroxyethylthiazole kinase-related/yjeF N-terminal region [Ornithinimicrobium cerasi]
MLQGYAVEDVRAAEAQVRGRLPYGELMQRAARGLAAVVRERAAERRATGVVVLAGPGDNGGDALHAAALLAGPLKVTAVGIARDLHARGLAAATRAGVVVHHVAPDGPLPTLVEDLLSRADLVVDGLLGMGARPGLRGAMAAALDAVPDTAYLISVDLPSGVDPAGIRPPGTTSLGDALHGRCVRDAARAEETVTFGMLKPAHLLPATEPAVGRLTVVDIGVPTGRRPVVERLEPADAARLWPVPGAGDHKYSRGVLGVVAGSDTYPGAAVLCTTAAVEAGAGMVRYLGPRRCADLVLAACPEVVPGPGRMQAAVVGPGIEPHGCDHPDCDDQVERVREAFADQELALVVDAGALPLLAGWLATGGRRAAPTLLTPHAGELAQLLADVGEDRPTREQVEADPVGHARRAAALTGCTVLLKGATTLVVDPDPAVSVRSQADAPHWLATAGAGDVLAGVAGVLLAGGLDPRDAGSLAAMVHGLAAGRANPGGPARALAVARGVPGVVASLLRG